MTKTTLPSKAINQPLSAVEQEQLVQQSIAGDRDALQQLCYAIARGVLFRTQVILGNHQDAEDAAQEVLLKVYTKISELRDPKAFNGWLNSILLRETQLIQVKNSKRNVAILDSDYLESLPEEDEDILPQEYSLREDERQIVMQSLDKLSVRQREAVLLHYFDGLNITQTASVMGISQQGASLYLKQARQKVKQELAKSSEQIEHSAISSSKIWSMSPAALLTMALQQTMANFNPEGTVWAQQAVENTLRIAPVGVATAAVAAKSASPLLARLLAGAVISAAAVLAIFATQLSTSQPAPAEPPAASGLANNHVTGVIEFTLTDPQSEYYVNPSSAQALAAEEDQGLRVLRWEICTVDSNVVLFEGTGSLVTEPLRQLVAAGPDGQYQINFYLERTDGSEIELSRDFTIIQQQDSDSSANPLPAADNALAPAGQ